PHQLPSLSLHDALPILYAGIKPQLGPATFDFGVLYYGYAGQTAAVDSDFVEFKAGVSGDILPKLNVGVAYYYTPDDSFEIGPGQDRKSTRLNSSHVKIS